MIVKALKDFSSTTHGNVTAGDVLDLPEGRAKDFNAHGLTAPLEYQTKVVRVVPTVAGAERQSLSSPADPAPAKKTRKKQSKKAESSPSTARFVSAPTRTRSTPETTSGGSSTAKTGETSED